MTNNTQVITQIDERGVASITLNRPEVHNAFDDNIIHALIESLTALEQNDAVRVLVLKSNGKNFSAGADLNWMRAMAGNSYEENLKDAGLLSSLMSRLDNFPRPTLCLVQGAAFAGAMGLVSCCDIAIATEKSSFCLSETRIGLIPAAISPYVMRAIGEKNARRYFLTAERFFADEAHRIGLINTVVADDEALALEGEKMLGILLGNGPLAMSAAKSLIKAVAEKEIDNALGEETTRRIAQIRVSSEGQEGIKSFLEKRKPNWIKE